VTVIIPNDTAQDENLVREAFAWIENDVVKSGIELRKYRNRMTHGKVATIDSSWATIGSTNLDTLSLERLSELNVAARDPRVARLFEKKIFEADLPNTDLVKTHELSFWKKAKAGFYHLFRSFI
jgi:phosphatidylserine/phosphatidylglycerophosphate/cardiolipin synthase-like enzyme